MLLVSFFEILSRFGVLCKKTIFRLKSRPLTVHFVPFCTVSGLDFKQKIGFLLITPKRLKISKNDTNIICTFIKNTHNFKVAGEWLKN